jgi:hypothetical protein
LRSEEVLANSSRHRGALGQHGLHIGHRRSRIVRNTKMTWGMAI